jgi:hypothetical protein
MKAQQHLQSINILPILSVIRLWKIDWSKACGWQYRYLAFDWERSQQFF